MPKSENVLGLEPRVRLLREPVARGAAHLLGFAELVIGGSFVIRDIRILKVEKEGAESVFVAFPSRKRAGAEGRDQAYYDVAFPITSASYKEATSLILKAFEEAAAKA